MTGFDLARWAAKRANLTQLRASGQDLLALSDLEIGYFIAHRDERYVLELISRGGPRHWLGSFPTEDAAKVMLIAVIGAIGYHPDLPRFERIRYEDRPADGVIRCRGAEFPWSTPGPRHAMLFERLADLRPDQVAAGCDAPKGDPLFSRP